MLNSILFYQIIFSKSFNYYLCSFVYNRGEKLIASYQLQKFNSELKELLDWIQEVKGQMEFGDLPKNLAEAESLIEEHQEIKASIIMSVDIAIFIIASITLKSS